MPIDPRSRGAMQTVRLPMPQLLAGRSASSDKDGLLKNCYEEDTPIGPMIVKRPGYELEEAFGAGQAQGATTFNDMGLFIVGDEIVSGLNFVNGGVWNPGSSNATGQARIGSAICANDENVLFISGGSGSGATDIYSDVWRSDDQGVSWSLVTASAPFGGRAFHNMFNLGGVLYVIGGYTAKAASALSTPTATVWKSSDQGVTWTSSNSMSSARAMFGASVLGTTIIVSGGVNGSGTLLNNVEKFNGTTWTTQTASASWTARRGLAMCSFNGDLYVAGGVIGAFGTPANYKNDVWRSIDAGVSWTQLTSSAAWSARMMFGLTGVDNKLLVYGGCDSSGTSLQDPYFSYDGVTWTAYGSASTFSARAGFAFCNFNFTGVGDTAMVYGGGTVNIVATATFTATKSDVYSTAIITGAVLSPVPPITDQPFQMVIIPASGTVPEKVFIKNNNIAYLWDGVTLTHITDTDYPISTVYGVVNLDGIVYVMNSLGQINGSDLNDPTSWNALNFITANSTPDRAVALVRQLNYIVAFKEFSTEFFYDAGNTTGSALSKVQNALLQIGLASTGSISFADNSVYFMANSKQKGRSIMKLDGYTPKLLSNPYIDRILNGDNLEEVYSFIIKSNGHFFYIITLVNSQKTLVFDEVTGKWHEWSTVAEGTTGTATEIAGQPGGIVLVTLEDPHGQEDGVLVTISGAESGNLDTTFVLLYNPSTMDPNQFGVVPLVPLSPTAPPLEGLFPVTFYTESYFPIAYYAFGNDKDLILGITDGNVYSFDPGVYEDNTLVIDVFIRSALVDMGVMASKRFNRLELVGDRVETIIYTRYTDDDYDTFSQYRAIKMAKSRAKISSLGSARRRAFDFKHAANTALRLVAAEIDYNIGAF